MMLLGGFELRDAHTAFIAYDRDCKHTIHLNLTSKMERTGIVWSAQINDRMEYTGKNDEGQDHDLIEDKHFTATGFASYAEADEAAIEFCEQFLGITKIDAAELPVEEEETVSVG